jgi:psp operon transcriptional activator
VSVDVRIIGATNADLPALARAGRFKEDLLDRLSFEVLHVPPLRDRRDDILLLARHFASRMGSEMGLAATTEFSKAAQDALRSHAWPGNIRELKNVVERAVYRAGGQRITEIVFDPFARQGATAPTNSAAAAARPAPPSAAPPPQPAGAAISPQAGTLREAITQLEIEMLERALADCRHHQRRAAERLGLTYHQFRSLYRRHAKTLQSGLSSSAGR